ncbi:aKG-HExxH-type peptide beta-hydroxylase [Actinoplanes sp. NPDC051513]|uniref:aKG-HExxH-type peptide beta-hydroxylase n=1 Tax=Actinoplanes sp. NPDC051513 TaxID=3363908 RepID=UPI0037AA840F
MIMRHRIPWRSFESLCSGAPDATALAVLGSAQLSKHLLLLRLVSDRLPAGSGVAAEALALLSDLARRDRPAVDLVLGYPYVAAGLAGCLRILRNGLDATPVEGYLAATAMAAAIHAGRDAELDGVPTARFLHLPTLGTADTAADDRLVRWTAGAGRLTVGQTVIDPMASGDDRTGWTGVRRLLPGSTPLFDDVDPNRESANLAAGLRLPAAEFVVWRDGFGGATAVLRHRHPGRALQVAEVLRAVTPLAVLRPGQGRSASARQAYGAVATTLPGNPVGFAATLIHETQHSVLNGLLDLVDLVDPSDQGLVYSPWRADPRPVGGLLHGCFAFLAIAEFWAREDAAGVEARAAFELARTRIQVRQALDTLTEVPALTADGRYVVGRLAERFARLESGPTPAFAARLAELAADDHRLSWRFRLLAPEQSAVEAAAKAWDSGLAAPALPDAAQVGSAVETFVPNGRIRRLGLIAAQGASSAGEGGPDDQLAGGRYRAAADAYTAAIRSNDDDLGAWTGLAIAGARLGGPGARVWSHRPELVRAVYQGLAATPVDPLALADWLAGGPRG